MSPTSKTYSKSHKKGKLFKFRHLKTDLSIEEKVDFLEEEIQNEKAFSSYSFFHSIIIRAVRYNVEHIPFD